MQSSRGAPVGQAVGIATLMIASSCANVDGAARRTGDPGSGGSGGQVTATGGTGTSGALASGGFATGGAWVCPTYVDWPPPNVPTGPFQGPLPSEPYQGVPSDFDADTFGCYPERELAAPVTGRPPLLSECNGECFREPRDLPCGACSTEGFVCMMHIWAVCNCGSGPFLQTNIDVWVCSCRNGTWDCRVSYPGSSCDMACPDGGSG